MERDRIAKSVVVVVQWVGHGRDELFKEKRVGCQASKENGAG